MIARTFLTCGRHNDQHRYLVKYLTYRCEEMGLRLLSVYARGTSYYAYDGSGPVKRDKTNACLATFSNGRRYNADLNGAQNIAARGLAILLGLKPHKEVLGACPDVRWAFCDRDWGVIGCPDYSA